MKVDQNTLERIFRIEGKGLEAYNPRLQDPIPENVTQVYPQDVADALRDIKRNDLIHEGQVILFSSKKMRLIRYQLKMRSKSSEQGRTVPNLELQLVKNTQPGHRKISIHGQLIYHYDRKDHYFAAFDV